jgi:hypothetical protein
MGSLCLVEKRNLECRIRRCWPLWAAYFGEAGGGAAGGCLEQSTIKGG